VRRFYRAAALALLACSTLGAFYQWGGPGREGVRDLRARRYAEAVRELREARARDPRSSILTFDQALGHAGAGASDSAQALYHEAMDGTGPAGRAAAAYNLGNDAMRAKQFAQARELYRESLRARSGDLDAKRNLEEAIRAMRGTPPPASPQSQGRGPKPPPKRGQEPGNPPPMAQSRQQNPPPQSGRGEFSRQEAEQWLQALEEERKASRHESRRSGEETGQRDW